MTSNQTSFVPTYPDGTPIHGILNPETSPSCDQMMQVRATLNEDDTPDQALARAASNDNIDVVRDLLQQGVEIDSRTRMCARSPAVWQLLLDHGAEINPYPSDHTPLLYVSSIFMNNS